MSLCLVRPIWLRLKSLMPSSFLKLLFPPSLRCLPVILGITYSMAALRSLTFHTGPVQRIMDRTPRKGPSSNLCLGRWGGGGGVSSSYCRGLLGFSNIHPIIASDAAWDRTHTAHTHQDEPKKLQTQGRIPSWGSGGEGGRGAGDRLLTGRFGLPGCLPFRPGGDADCSLRPWAAASCHASPPGVAAVCSALGSSALPCAP